MSFFELLLIAVSMSMDAFAVSICKGLSMKKAGLREGSICGGWFGGFQALMPIIGYFLGHSFAGVVTSVDHWIAFALLVLIGGNMLREAIWGDDEQQDGDFAPRKMFVMAVATSIDALAVGISFSCMGYVSAASLCYPLAVIFLVSFVMTIVGLALGLKCGNGFAKRLRAEMWGGIILLLIGVRVLFEHLTA